jgi:hypothetical protein
MHCDLLRANARAEATAPVFGPVGYGLQRSSVTVSLQLDLLTD